MPAIPHRDYSKLSIDGGSLSFLIENDSSFLISKILVVEDKFQEVINLINMRSEVHVGQLQPKLEKLGVVESKPFDLPIEKVESSLGVVIVGKLKRLTEGIIASTEDAIRSHEEVIKEIKSTGSKIFPNNRVLSFEYLNKDKKI